MYVCSCRRLISLASWTLNLCPSDAPVTASGGQPDVSVDVSKAGVQVQVSKGDDTASSGDNKATDRSFKAGDHAKGMLELLFPCMKSDASE